MITADVGGTSFDTCLIIDGRPPVLYEGAIVGLPLQTAVGRRPLDRRGRRLARLRRRRRPAPRRAAERGRRPGPGVLRPRRHPADGDRRRVRPRDARRRRARRRARARPRRCRAALAPLAEAARLQPGRGRAGHRSRSPAANMANAIREITIEQGQDPRAATLMPFGGAGPALRHAARPRARHRPRSSCRPYAGNFSAWGLLGADLAQTAARTRIMLLDDAAVAAANAILDDLFADARRAVREGEAGEREVGARHALRRSGAHPDRRAPRAPRRAHRRDAAGDPRRLHRDYERTFGHPMDEPVEIVSLRATVRTPLPRRDEQEHAGRHGARRRQAPFGPGRSRAVRRARLRGRRPRDAIDAARRSRARRSCSRTPRRPTSTPTSPRDAATSRAPSSSTQEATLMHEPQSSTAAGMVGSGSAADADPITTEVIRHGLNSAAEPDQARARAHVVLADHLRGPRLRGGPLRPAVPAARTGAEPARSSWAR